MSKEQIENAVAHSAGRQSPIELTAPWYVLVEPGDSNPDWELEHCLETTLGESMDRGLVLEAVVASDSRKARKIWELRHNLAEALHKGFSIANDTSVPTSQLPKFLKIVTARLTADIPACQVVHAGHIADGNIHVVAILDRKVYGSAEEREKAAARVNFIVHEVSVELGGSISVEHGIGLMHIEELELFKPSVDLEMMRTIKRSLDSAGIMNPGKILRAS